MQSQMSERAAVLRSLELLVEAAERGAEVMPFDLDRTTHEFAKTSGGGAGDHSGWDRENRVIETIDARW